MCGLAGFSGYFPADPTKLRMLLLDNESRGTDSTGIYGTRLMRKAKRASTFLEDVNFNHIASANVVVSHTRKSTGGALTKENAHPFVYDIWGETNANGLRSFDGTLIGTHNGWVVNEHEAEIKLANIGFKREVVDSASVFKAMAMTGDKTAFSMFEGAMALAFIFKGDLHLYTRGNRPLFLGRAKEGFYYSSLMNSLHKIGIPSNKVYTIKPHRLIKFQGSRIVEKIDIAEPRVSISDHTSSSYWENLVKDDKLMEELTGKKPTAPVQKNLGFTMVGDISTSQRNGKHSQESKTVEIQGSDTNSHIPKMLTRERLKTSIAMPRVIGSNFILPSSSDELNTPKKVAGAVKKLFYGSESSSGVTRMDRLQAITNFWPSKEEFFTMYKSNIFMTMDDSFQKKAPEMGITVRLSLEAVRKECDVPYLIEREGFYAMVELSGKKRKVFNLKNVTKDAITLYFSKVDIGTEECGDINLYLFQNDLPGLIHTSRMRLETGYEYNIKAYYDAEMMFKFKNSMRKEGPWFLESSIPFTTWRDRFHRYLENSVNISPVVARIKYVDIKEDDKEIVNTALSPDFEPKESKLTYSSNDFAIEEAMDEGLPWEHPRVNQDDLQDVISSSFNYKKEDSTIEDLKKKTGWNVKCFKKILM